MATSARLLEIKQWVANKRRSPATPSAQTDLAIALAYLEELTGMVTSSGYGNELRSESQDEYFGRRNQSIYQPSSLAQQINSVENNPDRR